MNFVYDFLVGLLVAAAAIITGGVVVVVAGFAYTSLDRFPSRFPRWTGTALWVVAALVIIYVVGADVRSTF